MRLLIITFSMLVIAAGVHAQPRESSVPGGIKIIELDGERAPEVRFQGQRVLVARSAQGWRAIVGLPLALAPGRYSVEIDRARVVHSESFEVTDKRYPVQRLTIPDQRKVDPAPSDLERIRREQRIIAEAKQRWTSIADVDLDFVLPADGPLSSRFGLARVLNGKPRAPHSGLDLAVPIGTPIRSTAAGVVSVTDDFFFNGKTVFVDHGQGLISMYCHLDAITVKPGERIARGGAIGRSGMTGRVTGPHLHWSVFLNGALVDPELFVPPRPGS